MRLSVPALASVRAVHLWKICVRAVPRSLQSARAPLVASPGRPSGCSLRSRSAYPSWRRLRTAGQEGSQGTCSVVGRLLLLRAAWMLVASSSRLSPLARPHPSPLPEGEGTSSVCQRRSPFARPHPEGEGTRSVCQRRLPLARPHPSPLPEGEGTRSACQRSITLTVRPWMPSCPAAPLRGSEGCAERERREQPEGRPGDATSGARADRSERGNAHTQFS